MKCHVIAALFVLLSSHESLAQTGTSILERTSTWVTAAGGIGTLTTSGGFCGRISVSHQQGRHLFSLRAFRITEWITDMVEPRSPRPAESETEFAVLYGRDLSAKSEYFGFSAGLAYVNSRHRGKLLNEAPSGLVHELDSIGSIGLALDAQIFLPLFRYFGLGLSFVGNVNSTRSFGGILVAAHFGSFD